MTSCLYQEDYDAFINVVEAAHDVTQFQVLSYNNVIVGKWNDELDYFEFDNNDDEEAWNELVETAQSNDASIDSESLDLLDEILLDKIN